jgi:ribosome biogenesis GTPase
MKGKIIKSIAGFYEVHTGEDIYRCRARGVFRALGVKPLVGDDVEIEITDTVSVPMEGNVVRLLPRRNELVRPNVANVDQALLIFAITHPAPSYNMLDRFLITMNQRNLPAILCFNKQDLATEQEIRELRETYESCGCRVLFVSVLAPETLGELRSILRGKTTVLTGPSGVGKSTLINTICPGARMQTGELSRKISRGKNTTRHVELLTGEQDTYLVDTPGFTSLYLMDLEAEDLRHYYPEFEEYEGKCRFDGCVHRKEPGCAVHMALEQGKISRIRYRNYCELFEELKGRKPDYSKKSGRKT